MRISLILPVYNEEQNLEKGSLEHVLMYLNTKNFKWEIIIVDDGSTDNTVKIIQEKYMPQYKNIRLIKKTHQGKAYSVIRGIKEAEEALVAFSDFDLATPIEEFDKLLKYKDSYDIIIGSRSATRKGAPMIRQIMSKAFIIIRDLIFNLNGIRDTQCGFKIFKRDVALRIINNLRVFRSGKKLKGPSVTAAFDLEFLYTAKKMGYRIKEVPVFWHYAETRKVSFFRDAYETIRDIIKIKFYDTFKS